MDLDLKNMEATRKELNEAAVKARRLDERQAAASSSLGHPADEAEVYLSTPPKLRTKMIAKRKLLRDIGHGQESKVHPGPSKISRVDEVPLNLVNLPDLVLNKIFSYFSFDETARLRAVCHRFDQLGQARLNRGFRAAELFQWQCARHIKARLPRRESVRRVHPLARHSDILSALETRISLLSMTFSKFIELNLCCFIPGKVIDELFRVLRALKADAESQRQPDRPFEVLKELRDISSMAMEHFDEDVAPKLKLPAPFLSASSANFSPLTALLPGSATPSTSSKQKAIIHRLWSPGNASTSPNFAVTPSASEERLRLTEKRLKLMEKKNKKALDEALKLVKEQGQMLQDQGARIANLETALASQQAVVATQAEKLKEWEGMAGKSEDAGVTKATVKDSDSPPAKRMRSADAN